MTDEVFTIEEAAAYLKLHVQTVYSLVRQGKLPARRVGKVWRLHRKALEDFLLGKQDAADTARERPAASSVPHGSG